MLIFFHWFIGQPLHAQSIFATEGKRIAVTGEIRNWHPNMQDPLLKIKTRDERGLIQKRNLQPLTLKRHTAKTIHEDPVWQQAEKKSFKSAIDAQQNAVQATEQATSSGARLDLEIEGQGFSNINPADPTLAVGPGHIIQMINGGNGSALFSIYDKKGKELIAPAYMDQLPGTSYNGGGDCIAWYDQFEDRFVMTEFGDSAKSGININTLVVAVSVSNDPTAGWYVYEFYCEGFIPDYPKYSNWKEAWYAVTRDFSDAYLGNSIWTFDKKAMINGSTTVPVQRTRLTDPDNKFSSLCPVTLGGNWFDPKETGALFMYFNDDELTGTPSDKDSIGLIRFTANFSNPSLSKVNLEKSFAVAAFVSEVCPTKDCAESPAGIGYDVVSNRIMNKPYLRDHGTYQTLVANHTVDVNGKGLAGIRWYAFKKQEDWVLHQQGTFSPQPETNCGGDAPKHRFMGSILQNASGQVLLAYNLSSSEDFASLAFTGRKQDDPLNTMGYEELIFKKGTGYGTVGSRWGDYNDMVPDPVNDSVFWFTGMYGKDKTSWGTKISALKLGSGAALDLKLVAIENPNNCNILCDNKINPRIRIRNNGTEKIQSLTISVFLNGVSAGEKKWNGSLSAGEEQEIAMDQLILGNGNNRINFLLSNPNNQPDQQPSNDSASISLSFFPPVSLPLIEDAESGTIPPAGWITSTNGSKSLNWKISDKAYFDGGSSFLMDNFNNNEKGKYADLISPLIELPQKDSVALEFMLAAALYNEQSLDTLEVAVSSECRSSYTTIYKKWGSSLATREGYATNDYYPSASEWRKESIGLRSFGGQKIRFRIRGINNNGNNIYIDKVVVDRVAIPERMKEKGYLIVPNPTGGALIIRFHPEANDLREILVTTLQGQVIRKMNFNSNQPIYNIPVDLSNQPDGTYLVVLRFGASTRTERIVKVKGQIP